MSTLARSQRRPSDLAAMSFCAKVAPGIGHDVWQALSFSMSDLRVCPWCADTDGTGIAMRSYARRWNANTSLALGSAILSKAHDLPVEWRRKKLVLAGTVVQLPNTRTEHLFVPYLLYCEIAGGRWCLSFRRLDQGWGEEYWLVFVS